MILKPINKFIQQLPHYEGWLNTFEITNVETANNVLTKFRPKLEAGEHELIRNDLITFNIDKLEHYEFDGKIADSVYVALEITEAFRSVLEKDDYKEVMNFDCLNNATHNLIYRIVFKDGSVKNSGQLPVKLTIGLTRHIVKTDVEADIPEFVISLTNSQPHHDATITLVNTINELYYNLLVKGFTEKPTQELNSGLKGLITIIENYYVLKQDEDTQTYRVVDRVKSSDYVRYLNNFYVSQFKNVELYSLLDDNEDDTVFILSFIYGLDEEGKLTLDIRCNEKGYIANRSEYNYPMTRFAHSLQYDIETSHVLQDRLNQLGTSLLFNNTYTDFIKSAEDMINLEGITYEAGNDDGPEVNTNLYLVANKINEILNEEVLSVIPEDAPNSIRYGAFKLLEYTLISIFHQKSSLFNATKLYTKYR